jgi:hypothetical protein
MQTAVSSGQLGPYTLGKEYRLSGLVRDLILMEAANFGAGLVRSQVTAGLGRLPNMNVYKNTLTADLATGDTVVLTGKTIKPDGTETAISISVDYDTSHANTAALVEAAIENDDSDVVVTRSSNNREFTLTAGADKRLVITAIDVTHSAAGTAEFGTPTKTTTDTVCGIASRNRITTVALSSALATRGLPTITTQHDKGSYIGFFYQGADPAVTVNNTVKPGDAVYCLLEDYTDQASVVNKRGTFRSDTDGGLAPVVLVSPAEFSYASSGGLAPLSINKA